MSLTTGNGGGAPGLEEVCDQLVHALSREGMTILGLLKVTGNPECMVCGYGKTCPMSALPKIFGEDTAVTVEKFCRVEDQEKTWQQAENLGRKMVERLQK